MEGETESLRSTPALPLEIQHLIIDNLYNFNSALKSCTLVCKGWLPVARSLLFYSVGRVAASFRGEQLIQFLLYNTHISRYVRKVWLGGVRDAKPLFTFLRTLPDITHVELRDLMISNDYGLDAGGKLLAILRSMPNLVELSVWCPHLNTATRPLTATARMPGFPKLSHLEAYNPGPFWELTFQLWSSIAQARAEHGSTPLHTLGVPIVIQPGRSLSKSNNVELGSLLGTVGEDLRHLIIKFSFYHFNVSDSEIEIELDVANLSACAYLSVLEIHIDLHEEAAQLMRGAAYLTSQFLALAYSISRIPGTAIDHLIIEIRTRKRPTAELIVECKASLEHLDSVLCQLSKLNKITFRATSNKWEKPPNDTHTPLFDWIIENLPSVVHKGLAIECIIR